MSQYEEDDIIADLLPQQSGLFFDAGCSVPIDLSNTWRLYQRGWHGLAVDVLDFSAHWAAHRPRDRFRQVAVGPRGRAVFRDMGMLTSAVEGWAREPVPGRADSILTFDCDMVPLDCAWRDYTGPGAPVVCDFLSLDIEGLETQAVTSCDWERFRPRVICIESLEYMTMRPTHLAWEPTLLTAGYRFVRSTANALNRFYVLER